MRAGIIRDSSASREWLLTLSIAASCCWHPWCCAVICDVHHIVGGAGRSDEFCNFSLLCRIHHMAYHGERPVVDGVRVRGLTMGELLAVKRKLDFGSWNPTRLAQLRGQTLPEIVEPAA